MVGWDGVDKVVQSYEGDLVRLRETCSVLQSKVSSYKDEATRRDQFIAMLKTRKMSSDAELLRLKEQLRLQEIRIDKYVHYSVL